MPAGEQVFLSGAIGSNIVTLTTFFKKDFFKVFYIWAEFCKENSCLNYLRLEQFRILWHHKVKSGVIILH